MLDQVLLLSEGKTVYFGAAKGLVTFFERAGVPCPSHCNPADHACADRVLFPILLHMQGVSYPLVIIHVCVFVCWRVFLFGLLFDFSLLD